MKALIFDFDGLIIDSERSEFVAWQEIYAAYGQQLPHDLWVKGIGTLNGFDPVDDLAGLVSRPVNRARLMAEAHQRNLELLLAAPILPGVEWLIEQGRSSGRELGLASTSPHSWVDQHLQRLGLFHHFQAICCRDDVSGRVKPDPAVYQAALSALGVQANQAIALEDSLNGVRAAKAADIFVVAIPNLLARHLDYPEANLRLDSLADFPLSLL